MTKVLKLNISGNIEGRFGIKSLDTLCFQIFWRIWDISVALGGIKLGFSDNVEGVISLNLKKLSSSKLLKGRIGM